MEVVVVYADSQPRNHAHKPGCRDIDKALKSRPGAGVEVMNVSSVEAAIKDLFGDILAGYPDEPDEWKSYVNEYDFVVAPCLSDLPVEEGGSN